MAYANQVERLVLQRATWYVPIRGLIRVAVTSLAIGSIVAQAAETATLRLVSADFPPFTVESGPGTPGALSEVVEKLADRIGMPVPIEFFPWQRAKIMPTKLHRVAVLPLTRIPEREHDYVWLVELYRQDYMFVSRGDRQLDLDSFDAMRPLRVGVMHGSAGVDMLQRRHFPHLVTGLTHQDLWRMLDTGLIDVIFGGREVETYRLRELGYNPKQFRFGKSLDGGSIWLGGSSDFTAQDVAQWTHAMDEIKQDGTYAQILMKYGIR